MRCRLDQASPFIFDRLDDEAQRRTDCLHVFVHDLLDDGRLAGIVQASVLRR